MTSSFVEPLTPPLELSLQPGSRGSRPGVCLSETQRHLGGSGRGPRPGGVGSWNVPLAPGRGRSFHWWNSLVWTGAGSLPRPWGTVAFSPDAVSGGWRPGRGLGSAGAFPSTELLSSIFLWLQAGVCWKGGLSDGTGSKGGLTSGEHRAHAASFTECLLFLLTSDAHNPLGGGCPFYRWENGGRITCPGDSAVKGQGWGVPPGPAPRTELCCPLQSALATACVVETRGAPTPTAGGTPTKCYHPAGRECQGGEALLWRDLPPMTPDGQPTPGLQWAPDLLIKEVCTRPGTGLTQGRVGDDSGEQTRFPG